jgi:hypothetical protein
MILLQAAIGAFLTVFPDYQDRVARHEAAHFLGIVLSCCTPGVCSFALRKSSFSSAPWLAVVDY